MLHKSLKVAIILSALVPSCLLAKKIDLMDLYKIANKNNPTYQQAVDKSNSSLQNIDIARSALFPQISAGASRANTYYHGANSTKTTTDTYSVSLNQAVFNLNAWRSYKSAKIQSHALSDVLKSSKQQLMVGLVKAYLSLAESQQLILIDQENVDQSKKLLDLANTQFTAGQSLSTDISQAKASLLAAESQLLSDELMVKMSRSALEQITLQPLYDQDIKTLRVDLPDYPIKTIEHNRLLDQAFHNNPTILSDKVALDAQRETIDANRASHWPTVSLAASYGQQSFAGDLVLDSTSRSSSISLSLNIPIFQGGLVTYKVKQSGYDYASLEQQLSIDKQTVRNLAQTSLDQLDAGVSLRKIDRLNLKAQQKAYEDMQIAYKSGQGNITMANVINAKTSVLSAKLQQLKNSYNYALSAITLRQALGDLSELDLNKLNHYLV
jgi:outer membrane protein